MQYLYDRRNDVNLGSRQDPRPVAPTSPRVDQEAIQTMNQIKLIVHRLLEEQPDSETTTTC